MRVQENSFERRTWNNDGSGVRGDIFVKNQQLLSKELDKYVKVSVKLYGGDTLKLLESLEFLEKL